MGVPLSIFGIFENSVYVSYLRLTRSIIMSSIITYAVSKCFALSPLTLIVVNLIFWFSLASSTTFFEKNSAKRFENSYPFMSSRAISMSSF